MARTRRGGGRGVNWGRSTAVGHGRQCQMPGCAWAAVAGTRFCRTHGRGEMAEAERRAMRRLLGEVEAMLSGEVSSAERERRAAALWRRAVRGDFGTLLDERLAAATGEVETGRVRALLKNLVGAVAISLGEVMADEEGDALERSLAVSRLAQAAGKVVGIRRTLAADQEEDTGTMLWRVLEELDAEQGVGESG